MRSDHVLAELARDRGDDLIRYAYLLTSELASAQDLVQDAFVKVFGRTRNGFSPDVAEAYVRRTIVTLYVDGFRRRRRWASVQHLLPPDDVGASDLEARLDLRAALATLTPQERAAVVLRYYEDLPVAEVAARMGLADGTVKRYLSNALGKLEGRLGPIATPADQSIAVLAADAARTRTERS